MIKLSEKQKKHLADQVESLPSMMGKIIMTWEFSCGMGGVVNSIKVKKFTEEDFKE